MLALGYNLTISRAVQARNGNGAKLLPSVEAFQDLDMIIVLVEREVPCQCGGLDKISATLDNVGRCGVKKVQGNIQNPGTLWA
jgi:hypothetical protein